MKHAIELFINRYAFGERQLVDTTILVIFGLLIIYWAS